jgi:chromosome segregation ATPase
MAIMLGKTYAAFKAAGVSDEQAEAAAEELAGYETRLASIDNRLASLDGKLTALDARISALADKLNVVVWAVGINAAATIAILGVLLRGHGPL